MHDFEMVFSPGGKYLLLLREDASLVLGGRTWAVCALALANITALTVGCYAAFLRGCMTRLRK